MSEEAIQEVADILSKKIDYEAIDRLALLTQSDHVHVIRWLCELYQILPAYQSIRKRDSMDFFHNQGYAGI